MTGRTARGAALGVSACAVAAVAIVGISWLPDPTRVDPVAVVVAEDPVQAPAADLQPLRLTLDGTEYVLTPRARYVLRGVVVGCERYRVGWQAALAPYDVAMVWGPLARDGLFRRVSWWQENRWYFWRYRGDFGHDNEFVYRHSANTHLIPASERVAQAIRALEFGASAELAGILVDVGGQRDGSRYWWNTSLSRGDTGDGSCEVLYLARVKVGREVWE